MKRDLLKKIEEMPIFPSDLKLRYLEMVAQKSKSKDYRKRARSKV